MTKSTRGLFNIYSCLVKHPDLKRNAPQYIPMKRDASMSPVRKVIQGVGKGMWDEQKELIFILFKQKLFVVVDF